MIDKLEQVKQDIEKQATHLLYQAVAQHLSHKPIADYLWTVRARVLELESIISLAHTHKFLNYSSVEKALTVIADAREYQTKAWPDTLGYDAGNRPAEEWLCLLQHYQNKLMAVYSESDGKTVEGRARFAKYAAVVANLALWLVQATQGPVLRDKELQTQTQG
jgi:hypothetical protein